MSSTAQSLHETCLLEFLARQATLDMATLQVPIVPATVALFRPATAPSVSIAQSSMVVPSPSTLMAANLARIRQRA